MTEKSYLWTAPDVGDGVAEYTRVDTSEFMRIVAACHAFEGVAPNYLNALAGSVPGANTVRIASGGALVDGKPYSNTTPVDVNIPSAVGGGNTRIDRIVLRADWTTQTVRITRIEGVDAANPGVPVIDQTPGVTYDIPLYQVLVNTSGDVTLTDERVFASPITHRQGGSPTDWGVAGTTNYPLGGFRIQIGNAYWVASSGTVTFPVPFAAPPIVIPTPLYVHPSMTFIQLDNVTASEFTVRNRNADGVPVEELGIHWIAIGPR